MKRQMLGQRWSQQPREVFHMAYHLQMGFRGLGAHVNKSVCGGWLCALWYKIIYFKWWASQSVYPKLYLQQSSNTLLKPLCDACICRNIPNIHPWTIFLPQIAVPHVISSTSQNPLQCHIGDCESKLCRMASEEEMEVFPSECWHSALGGKWTKSTA